MVIKLKRLRLYVRPKDQYLGRKKAWKHFHLQLTTEVYIAEEAKKKQTGYFPGNRPCPRGAQACFVIDVITVRMIILKC